MATTSVLPTGSSGRVLRRGESGYEDARRSAVWNARKPPRHPDLIVTVASDRDVVAAVDHARAHGLKLAVRAGGHSMCGSPLREGGMLLDLSRLRDISINPSEGTAIVQPAVTARDLARALAEHGLAFPVGHCGSVPVSGYLLSGGLGWNVGAWGPACFSLRRLWAVTAGAELVTADARENPGLLWAARGAGPGFPAVATRFEVGLQPLPGSIRTSTFVYTLADVEEVSAWAAELVPSLPRFVELHLVLASAPPGSPAGPAGKALGVSATAFADTADEAERALAPLLSCPALGRALVRRENRPSSIESLQDELGTMFPEHHRYLEESLWSDQPLPVVLPRLPEYLVGAPSAKSFVLTGALPPRPEGVHLPDAAFSMAGRTFILSYAIWEDEADDPANERWFRRLVDGVEPLSHGHYVAETDLFAGRSRAAGSFAPPNWEKLRTLRAEYDPDHVFHTFPDEG
ncbi:FAD-binding oxidoreductase [Streptomyces sp.]|uniref:FAD-binding oxidoreductase n=1 Tax=Streptomyces sp. TaxID=1931 RepID=UPI002D7930C8|nr:FAD-binding oxidoreductase [Streptomyces sp.]HET6358867.1 FAD-binding oxidoreductase [Streptomyces sp.]